MIQPQDFILKNPWWSDPTFRFPEASWQKRDLYQALLDHLDTPFILNVIGLRRVGKSTVLRQVIAHLLTREDPKRVFYYLFDARSQLQAAAFLDEVLSAYTRDILNRPTLALDERVFVFLDEIQYIEDWPAVLKKFYDLSGKRIKFFVTGSQSLLLKGKNRESLAGRVFDFSLPPLSFREFLALRNVPINPFPTFSLFDLPAHFGELAIFEATQGQTLAAAAREFITTGQFPETGIIPEPAKQHEYLAESVIGKVLDDGIRLFSVEKPDEFKRLAYQLIQSSGSIFEIKNLSRELGLSVLTVDKYLRCLRDSSLLNVLFRYHTSLGEQGRILKKIYAASPNFVCAQNYYTAAQVDEVPQAFGGIVETAIHETFRRRYPPSEARSPLSFWRQSRREIDFLVTDAPRRLPIEVKFSNAVTRTDAVTIAEYVRREGTGFGIIVTKRELERRVIHGQPLYLLPYSLALLLD